MQLVVWLLGTGAGGHRCMTHAAAQQTEDSGGPWGGAVP
jgi:hypothetical protein